MNVFSFWRAGFPFPAPDHTKLVRMIHAAAEAAGLNDDNCRGVCVTFLSAKKMAEINWDYLRHTGFTDVISFDYRDPDEPCVPGESSEDDDTDPDVELFVCPAFALKEATKRGLPYEREVALYVSHGLLHAAGYDDLNPKAKRVMRRAEKRVMAALDRAARIPSMRVEQDPAE